MREVLAANGWAFEKTCKACSGGSVHYFIHAGHKTYRVKIRTGPRETFSLYNKGMIVAVDWGYKLEETLKKFELI